MDEVWKVAKVGSKRTPSYPAYCFETQGSREGSERRLYPPDEGTIAKFRRQKGAYIAGILWRSEEIQAMARVRAHFDGVDQVNYILNYQLD